MVTRAVSSRRDLPLEVDPGSPSPGAGAVRLPGIEACPPEAAVCRLAALAVPKLLQAGGQLLRAEERRQQSAARAVPDSVHRREWEHSRSANPGAFAGRLEPGRDSDSDPLAACRMAPQRTAERSEPPRAGSEH
jgi:hypothetical protein